MKHAENKTVGEVIEPFIHLVEKKKRQDARQVSSISFRLESSLVIEVAAQLQAKEICKKMEELIEELQEYEKLMQLLEEADV